MVTDHPPLEDAKEEEARLEPGATPRPFSEAIWGLRYCAASFRTLEVPAHERLLIHKSGIFVRVGGEYRPLQFSVRRR